MEPYPAYIHPHHCQQRHVNWCNLGYRNDLHIQTSGSCMKSEEGFKRMRLLQVVVVLIFTLIGGRLLYLQIIDTRYSELAKANVLRHVVQYPPRGEVFDRNGEYLVQSKECYDLMVIHSEVGKRGFDTTRLCEVLGLPRERFERELANARIRPRAPRLVMSYISKEDKRRFDECNLR